jgi:hypothetical protein
MHARDEEGEDEGTQFFLCNIIVCDVAERLDFQIYG